MIFIHYGVENAEEKRRFRLVAYFHSFILSLLERMGQVIG